MSLQLLKLFNILSLYNHHIHPPPIHTPHTLIHIPTHTPSHIHIPPTHITTLTPIQPDRTMRFGGESGLAGAHPRHAGANGLCVFRPVGRIQGGQ